jgi:DNA (cytosine-5)-methyltransferase 1
MNELYIQRRDGEGLRELALFAGAGGGILGGHLLGWRTVCAVERDAYAAQVLAQRQNDGCLRPFPIWSDVCSFDGRPWRGIVDVVSGGFPCQDISASGNGKGLSGERSGLWTEMFRIIREVEPEYVFVENSPILTSRGLGTVLGDLASIGFDAQWDVFSAADFGADHLRERIWIVAHSNKILGSPRAWPKQQSEPLAHDPMGYANLSGDSRSRWVALASQFRRMDDGMAHSVDRTAALGNGQVPRVAAAAFTILSNRF